MWRCSNAITVLFIKVSKHCLICFLSHQNVITTPLLPTDILVRTSLRWDYLAWTLVLLNYTWPSSHVYLAPFSVLVVLGSAGGGTDLSLLVSGDTVQLFCEVEHREGAGEGAVALRSKGNILRHWSHRDIVDWIQIRDNKILEQDPDPLV